MLPREGHIPARRDQGRRPQGRRDQGRILTCEAFQARHVLVKDLAKAAQAVQGMYKDSLCMGFKF